MESTVTNSKRKKLSVLMLSCGMSIGTGLGIVLGVAFDNIPIGLSIGAGTGIAIGIALSNYYGSSVCVKK